MKMLSLNDFFFLPASVLLLFFLRNRFIGSFLSIPLINAVHKLLVNNNKGEGRGGLKREGGHINFLPLRRVGGLIREGAYLRGGA